LTPLLVTALFNIFTNLFATNVITAACHVVHVSSFIEDNGMKDLEMAYE
jgi:hypothetical protein